jgi:alkanesulfonate monooxygenase SsuD/methylene tetrahydromethanopterin reductase-like flavin-dependent oxidoreductase (luciferase family)
LPAVVSEVIFGLDTFGDVPMNDAGTPVSHARAIRQLLDEAVLADQLGVDVFTVGEHHRPEHSVSAPETVLAGMATLAGGHALPRVHCRHRRRSQGNLLAPLQGGAGQHGSIYVGSPETVAKRIARTVASLDVGRFDLIFTSGAQPPSARLKAPQRRNITMNITLWIITAVLAAAVAAGRFGPFGL